MRTNAFRAAAVAATLLLVLAACGDDSSTDLATDQTEAPIEDQADDGHDDDHADDAMDDDAMDDDMEMDDESHDHMVHEVTGAVPTVGVQAVPDPAGGLSIFVTTTDYSIAPHHASTDHVDGEGHFHLYVDGEKLLRFYNEDIYVEGIPEGEVTVEVELSANDHGPYTIDGEPIRASTTVVIPAHEHDGHDHGEPEPLEFTGPAPTAALTVEEDPMSGWNVFVDVEGFTLSGEHASGEHVEGEGHIHLYVDDLKLMRLYGTAAHLAALPPGDHLVRVELFTNDHRPYVIGGVPIEAAVAVTVTS